MLLDSNSFLISILLVIVSGLSFYKWRLRAFVLVIPFLAFLFFKIDNYIIEFPFYVVGIVTGAVAGFSYREKKSFQFYITLSSIIYTLVMIILYFYLLEVKNIELISRIKDVAVTTFDKSMMKEINAETKMMLEAAYSNELSRFAIPSLAFMMGIMSSVFALFVLKIAFAIVLKKRFFWEKDLEHFRLNDYSIFGLIFCLAGIAFIEQNDAIVLYFIIRNCLFMMIIFYFIQALGVLRYFIIAKKWPTFLIPLAFFVIIAMGNGALIFTVLMLAGWGALDLWTDFRKFNQPRESNDSKEI